ncbi:unnamed protein product, partial [Tetraodon nigroviridis]
DGKVYAMGGMGLDTAPQALVRVYEAAKDRWQPLTSMPTPRYGATPFIRGKQVFLMGPRTLRWRVQRIHEREQRSSPLVWVHPGGTDPNQGVPAEVLSEPACVLSLCPRWSPGKDARDCPGGLRPGDQELDPLPLHPHPQGLLPLRRQPAESLQHRGSAAARTSQLLLQASLRQHHGGVRPGPRQVPAS